MEEVIGKVLGAQNEQQRAQQGTRDFVEFK
jgi:hypothetical protein